jgi:hypothetical protein
MTVLPGGTKKIDLDSIPQDADPADIPPAEPAKLAPAEPAVVAPEAEIATAGAPMVTQGAEVAPTGELPVATGSSVSFEDATPGEIIEVPDAEITPQATEPEIEEMSDEEADASLSPELRKKSPGVGTRLGHALFGDGIDDQLEIPRAAGSAGGSILGGTLLANRVMVFGVQVGSKIPVAPGPLGIFINPITGTLVGGALGAFVGTYLPETTASSLEFVLGDVFGMDEFKNFRQDPSFLTPAQIQYKAENEALFDIATGGGFTLIKYGTRAVGRLASAAGKKEAQILTEKGNKLGLNLTPIQVGERTVGATFFNVMGRFPWLGTGASKMLLSTVKGLRSQLDTIGTRLGPLMSDSDISVRVFNDARDLMIDTNKYFKRRYTSVFARAKAAGVRVIPNRLIKEANEIIKDLNEEAIVNIRTGELVDGVVLAKVREFITSRVGILSGPVPGGSFEGAPKLFVQEMDLKQLDGFLSQVDQELAALSAAEKNFAFTLLARLKTAALTDMVSEGSVIGRGVVKENGKEITVTATSIIASMRSLDQEFSYLMSEVFESTAANQLGRTVKGGTRKIKGSGKQGSDTLRGGVDEVFKVTKRTQVQIDQIGATLLKLDSPASVTQVRLLVGDETFKAIAVKALDDAVQTAMKGVNNESGFSADKFAKALGLTGRADNKAQSLKILLEQSGHPWKVKDFEDFLEVARAVEKVSIPGVSTFLQRKAIIGGIKGAVTGMLPGIALVATGASGGWVGAAMGMAIFIGGNKMLMRMISNPRAAKTFKEIASLEATDIARRKAYVRLFKETIQSVPDTEWAQEHKQAAMQAIEISGQAFHNHLESMK